MRNNLRTRRLELGMTQKELGVEALLSDKMICALERGRSKGSVTTWERLEAALGVDEKLLRQVDEETT